MKITIQRSTLLERLSQVIKALNTKPAMPILEGVLIQAHGELTLVCSDVHFSIMTQITEYDEHEAGETVIPAKKLLEVISKMPDKPIDITVSESSAVIKCGSTRVSLPAMDPEQFPEFFFPVAPPTSIDGKDFVRLVESTAFATTKNENMPILMGVCFEVEGDCLITTATDRHRLARQVVGIEGAEEGKFVVPVRALDAVAKMKPEKVRFAFDGNRVYLETGDYQVSAAMIDGTYPDTSRIIPQQAETKVFTDTEQLLAALELAEKVADGKTRIVKLDISDGEMLVTAKDDSSAMEEVLEAEIDGNEIAVTANARYMIDALKTIDTERVEIWLTGIARPMILKAENDDDGLQLVLPYRTAG